MKSGPDYNLLLLPTLVSGVEVPSQGLPFSVLGTLYRAGTKRNFMLLQSIEDHSGIVLEKIFRTFLTI